MKERRPTLTPADSKKLYEHQKEKELNSEALDTMLADAKHFREVYIPMLQGALETAIDLRPWKKIATKEKSTLNKLAFLEPGYYDSLRNIKEAKHLAIDLDLLTREPQLIHTLVSDLDNFDAIAPSLDALGEFRKFVRLVIAEWPAYEKALGEAIDTVLNSSENENELSSVA